MLDGVSKLVLLKMKTAQSFFAQNRTGVVPSHVFGHSLPKDVLT